MLRVCAMATHYILVKNPGGGTNSNFEFMTHAVTKIR